MNKLLVGTLLAFTCIRSYADDLKVADDFKSGDLVSADTFNQIFGTLEQINRTVIDADLVGVWSCAVSEHSANTASTVSGWSQKGLIWELTGAQINMTASSGSNSKEAAYTISTGAPSPLYTTSSGASTGTYVLFEGMMFVKIGDSTATHTYEVDIVSNDRITLKGNAELGPPQPTFLVCDSAEAVPASPTSPTATNNKTGINLAWTDSSSDETGFKVFRKLSTETEAKVIATQTGVTYSDTDLSEGQTAYYHVTAYNDNGDSAKSKTVSRIADFTAPTITSVTPGAGTALSGPGNGFVTLLINFSESIETTPRQGSSGKLVSMKVNGVATLSAGFTVLNAGSELLVSSLSAGVEYQNSSTYEITVDKGWVTDANGIGMEEDYIWSFTTP
ncbi:hypothetical protein OAB62_02920 [Pseudomonadales bacterium]|nr:hypothetical protein [Pseudomonadales bacterium]